MKMINQGDTAWVLISSAMVMLMTPALGFFYGGMVRRKNVLSTIMMCCSVVALISIQWVLFGYSLAFGPDKWHLIGSLQWAGFNGVGQTPNADYAATIPHQVFASFQAMFAVITPALIVAAFVERIKFTGFMVLVLLWATVIYDPVAHWVWGVGGWLRQMGALDFAGGTVVHITAGMSALALAIYMGQRKGYGRQSFEPNNIPYVVLGAFLLWFGWFGFNAGSALGANGLAGNAFIVTNTAAAAAGLVWMILSSISGKPSVMGFATGAVVGLVAITPACGYVGVIPAIIIGAVAASISYAGILIRNRSAIDESLDAFACHGLGGITGALLTGVFASKLVNPAGADGLLHGNPHQLLVQAVAVLVVAVYSFGLTFLLAAATDRVFGLRVEEHEEEVGLDLSQHAEKAFA
ncbi:MAG: ammonium transporter [bacterium]|nr:ammonium transporter [bacterium]